MVPPYSGRITRVPPYSSDPLDSPFCVQGYHFLWLNFPDHSTRTNQDDGHWAIPRSLATTSGISVDFFSSRYLDVSVPWVCFAVLCIQTEMLLTERVSPFGNLRIKVCLPTPRSLSQATTSFIASYCQGIHRMRLFT